MKVKPKEGISESDTYIPNCIEQTPTPTEYEQFLINREGFIEYILGLQERLTENYILPMMTRQDLIELASNPAAFIALKRCLSLEKLQNFDSNKKIKAYSSW